MNFFFVEGGGGGGLFGKKRYIKERVCIKGRSIFELYKVIVPLFFLSTDL